MIESYILIGSNIYQEGCNRCSAHSNSSGVKCGVMHVILRYQFSRKESPPVSSSEMFTKIQAWKKLINFFQLLQTKNTTSWKWLQTLHVLYENYMNIFHAKFKEFCILIRLTKGNHCLTIVVPNCKCKDSRV